MATACPECDAQVELPETVRMSEIVECPDCRTDLEVIMTEPPALALAPELEEDWGE